MSETYSTLQGYIEEYLKREGLFDIVPEYRRTSLFTLPIATFWFVMIFLMEGYVLSLHRGINGLLAGILIPLCLGAVLFSGLIIFFVFRQFVKKKQITSSDASFIGGIFLFGFPIILAVVTGIYLNSWSAILWILGLSILGTSIIVLLHTQTFRIFRLFELTRSILRTIAQSFILISLLLPILLAIILLSIFAQDLWNALGNLSPLRIVGSIVLITLPAFLLVRVSGKKLVRGIIGEFPKSSVIINNAKQVAFIKDKLEQGYISEEEWTKAEDELNWRHQEKLDEALAPLEGRIARLFGLLLLITNIVLIAVFFIYFFILFWMLIGETLVSTWTNIPSSFMDVPLTLWGTTWQFKIPSAMVPLAKVSLLLGVFVAVITTTQAMTDDSFKQIFTERLKQKYDDWLAVGSIYLSITSPNYQMWKYKVNDRKAGRANVFIVVPQNMPEEKIRAACDHMLTRLEKYKHWVRITAFEKNPDSPIYDYANPGKRWMLHQNKVNGKESFEENHLVLDEVYDDHFLGQKAIDNNEKIVDEWFGEPSEGAELGRILWNSDAEHSLILHPRIRILNDGFIIADIRVKRKFTKSKEYREFVYSQFSQIRQFRPKASKIMVDVLFRDTIDRLANLDWNNEIDLVTYSDEIVKKSKYQPAKEWDGLENA